MWVAEIELNGENALLGSRTKKYHVSLAGYPVSFYKKGNKTYLSLVGFLFGEDKNKRRFIEDLKKDKRTVNIETHANFIIGQIIELPGFEVVYNPKIIHLKPIFIDENAKELWTIASWDKKQLIKIKRLLEKTHEGKLFNLRQEKIKDFSIISVQPQLTKKQKRAMEIAVRTGYYNYPRKIKLEKMAEMMNLSYSTFQAHIRKAEQKLIPFIFNLSQEQV